MALNIGAVLATIAMHVNVHRRVGFLILLGEGANTQDEKQNKSCCTHD